MFINANSETTIRLCFVTQIKVPCHRFYIRSTQKTARTVLISPFLDHPKLHPNLYSKELIALFNVNRTMTCWNHLTWKSMKNCHCFDHFSIALITSHRIKKNVGSELANAFNQEMRDVSSNPGHLAHSIKDLYSNHPALEESCKTEADTQSIRIIASSDW